MELLHPSLDNNLGGSWRASGFGGGEPPPRRYLVNEMATGWRYRKATSAPSTPEAAWRQLDFVEDDTWLDGQTSIGFGDDDDNTLLEDMRDNYTGVYLRHEFSIEDTSFLEGRLKLGVYVDDGAVVWLNGVEVARLRTRDDEELTFESTAARATEARWEDFALPSPRQLLQPGRNILAVHAMNVSVRSNDFSADATIFVPGAEDADDLTPPSPGGANSVLSETAPPQVRQVSHFPEQPTSDDVVVVSAKVTDPDGVESVRVLYQVVEPGHYIPATLPHPHATLISRPDNPQEPNPEFTADENWVVAAMFDDGTSGDVTSGDSIYSALIPRQSNRTLMRYRIETTDSGGATSLVPFEDDPVLNFAYFVYDGVPDFVAQRSVVEEGHVHSAAILTGLPVYFLLTRSEDMQQCLAYNGAFVIPKSNENARDRFNWEGAFVYNGRVYDHVHYRLRQANDRYGGRGKRSMRIRFNKGDYVQLHDNYGRPYPRRWRTINTGKMFDNKGVGNFGLTETMNAHLWNGVGVPAPWFHTFHFRVIDGEEEQPTDPLGQYRGDFWGMHVAIEDYDPRLSGSPRSSRRQPLQAQRRSIQRSRASSQSGPIRDNHGRRLPEHSQQPTPQRDDEWLRAHVNYDRWYRYHAVVEGIRHYDFVPADSHSKNRAWYFEPFEGSEFGRVWTLPWDSDASWGPNWNSGVDYSKNAIFGGRKAEFKQAYRNYLREFRDLVWTEEVIEQMIDDLAAFVMDFSQADRDRWRGGPPDAGNQDFGDIGRKIIDMKRFAFVSWSGPSGPSVPAGGRARHLDTLAGAEGDNAGIPATPVVTAQGPANFPADGLRFEVDAYSDPQGDAFAALQWRLGEVTPADAPFDPTQPRIYEWTTVWEANLETLDPSITIPVTEVVPGSTYRVRAKWLDATGRWSHWSTPVEFVVSAGATPIPSVESLRITELMYHPERDEDLEFIELQNIGGEPLSLVNVHFVDGVEFSFDEDGLVEKDRRLQPGEFAVVVRNLSVFERFYDTGDIVVLGEYRGRLDNAGEALGLRYGSGFDVLAFSYVDTWHPQTDGLGRSLTLRNASTPPEAFGLADSWLPSAVPGGTPGKPDGNGVEGGLRLPGDVNPDGSVNVLDPIALFRHIFVETPTTLPCGDGTLDTAGNRRLLDVNGDEELNLADALHLLNFAFQRGAPPAMGVTCTPISGCSDACN